VEKKKNCENLARTWEGEKKKAVAGSSKTSREGEGAAYSKGGGSLRWREKPVLTLLNLSEGCCFSGIGEEGKGGGEKKY